MSPRRISIAISVARRQAQSTTSTVPSGPVIIGIAVAGAVILCVILAALGIHIARVVHRRELAKPREVRVEQDVGKDIRAVLEMTQPEEWPRRQSLGRMTSQHKRRNSSNSVDEDPFGPPSTPKMARILKRRSLSPQKPFIRISGMRDSWPLVSHIQMPPHLQLPLGGLVEIPPAPDGTSSDSLAPTIQRWPTRTYSRASRQNLVFDTSDSPESQPFSRVVETRPPKGHHKRCSTSESQLSSILRSTSQRLKRNSITKARNSIGQFPGSPPKDRLPSPPTSAEKPMESRDKFMTPEPSSYAGSINSSIYERYINCTPSPGKIIAKGADQPEKREKSPAPSAASDDSLCGGKITPDLVIPAPLSSPSKRSTPGEQRHRVLFSSGGASSGGSSDISSLMHKDARSSVSALGNRNSILGNRDSVIPGDRNSTTVPSSIPIRISLQSDPFYSSVRTSTPPIRGRASVPGPRPFYIRKSTFGGEATPERPSSYVSTTSPLRNVSGNQQTPSKKANPPASPVQIQSKTLPNPFMWFPQEAMAHKVIKTSGSRRRARTHKRSHTDRIASLSRPQSVATVPESSEEDSTLSAQLRPMPLNTSAPSSPSRFTARLKSPFRPPSVADFNPSLEIPQLPPSADGASTLDHGESQNRDINCSPTLSMHNYYSHGSNSEDEFFKNASLVEATSRRKGRRFSVQQSGRPVELTSFPLQSFPDPKVPVLAPSSAQCSTTRPTSLNMSPPATPAPSLLSTAQISHFNGPQGPRNEPPKTGITMETQICMLRRMNSEVSEDSAFSSMAGLSPCSEDSPTLPDWPRSVVDDRKRYGKEPEGHGSKYYLNIGTGALPSKRRTGGAIRDSIMMGRVCKRVECEKEKHKFEEDEYETIYDPTDFFSGGQLTPIRVLKKKTKSPPRPETPREEMRQSKESPAKNKTPPTGLNIHSLKYPILSPAGQSTIITSSPPVFTSSPPAFTYSPDRTPVQSQGRIPVHNHRTPTKEARPSTGKTPSHSYTPSKDEKRWSDAMIKPSLNGLRSQRESKMEMPTPQMPPKWANLGISRYDASESQMGLLGQENGRIGFEKKEPDWSRPESLDLYDQDGFLRTSPERARMI